MTGEKAIGIPLAVKVILLHGIVPTPASSFTKLEGALRRRGHKTLNLSYPLRKKPLEDLVEEIRLSASTFIKHDDAAVHFVTHSMGVLVVRAYITRHRPGNLGRVVMLGLPNQGSELADLLSDNFFYSRIFGPAGKQLRTVKDDRLLRLLVIVDFPLGIIAGDRTIDPLGWLIIPGPNDGRVSVARTMVPGISDHLTLHVDHTLMVCNAAVIRQTPHFLREGRFEVGLV